MAKADNPIETDLVTLAKQGNAEAFEELAKRARPLCQTVARSILGDDAEAEDQVQNAVFKAWRNIDQFRRDASFTAWLCRIATNECLMVVRRRAKFPQLPIENISNRDDVQAVQFRDTRADPEELAASGEVKVMLSRELRRVPKIFRTMLVMVDIGGLSIEEIATELGISTPAAKSRLVRARRALRERVETHTSGMGLSSLLPQR